MKIEKLNKTFVNRILITIFLFSIFSSVMSEPERALVLKVTIFVTFSMYIYIVNSLVKLKIPNPEQSLIWTGFVIYTVTFWATWQIVQEINDNKDYRLTFVISSISGFVGIPLCMLLAHISDRIKKTW